MPFDRAAAKAAGYTDAEIDAFLADQPAGAGPAAGQPLRVTIGGKAKAFDQEGALAAGWTQQEINDYLAGIGPRPGEPGNEIVVSNQPETTPGGMMGAVLRGAAPVAAGAALGSIIPGVGTLAGAGLGGLTALVGDPLITGANALLGTNIPTPSEGIAGLLDVAGLPRSDTAAERTVESVSRGVSGAAGGIGLGQTLMQGAAPLTQAIGQTIAAQPVAQGVGAGASSMAGQSVEEIGAGPWVRLAAELGTALTIGGATTVGQKMAEMLSSKRMALADLAELGINPEQLRQTYVTMQKAIGRMPTLAEVLGETVARLRPTLAPDPSTPGRVAEAALAARQGTLAGTRERASAVGMAQQAQDAAEQSLRTRIGEGNYAEQARTELQIGMRQRLPAAEAASETAMQQRIRETDKANYKPIEKEIVPVEGADKTALEIILLKTPMATEVKSQIGKRLERGELTGLDLQVLRTNLMKGPRQYIDESGRTFTNMAEDIDNIAAKYLPAFAKARRKSFEARSAAEGAAQGQAAVESMGNRPLDHRDILTAQTPEQRAGRTLGGAQGALNLTSSQDKAYKFAARLGDDADYSGVVRTALPPAIANDFIDYAIKGRGVVDQLDALGLTGLGGDPAKFRAMTKRLLEDKAYVATMRQRLPKDIVDDAVNYARVQRDFIQKVDDLGLTDIGKDFGKAYNFASRVELDPDYAAQVARDLPGGDELVQFALQNKKAVDSVSALIGIPPARVATMADDVQGLTNTALIAFGPAGGNMISNAIMKFLNRNFGLGKGPAKAMADMLLDPKKFEPTMKALEARGVNRDALRGVLRGALFSAAMNGGPPPPEPIEEPQ